MTAKVMGLIAVALLCAGCASSGRIGETGFAPGEYEGTGRGYRGAIHVRLSVDAAGIEGIEITRHRESFFPGAAAMEALIEAVLESGWTDVDVVAGATFSSRGFLEAVEDALRKAVRQ